MSHPEIPHYHEVAAGYSDQAAATNLASPTSFGSPTVPLRSPAAMDPPSPSTGGQQHSTGSNPPGATMEDLLRCLGNLAMSGSKTLNNVENYDGEMDCDMFISAVEEVARANHWSNSETVKAVEGKLRGKAREYYGVLLQCERPRNLRDFKEWLKKLFGKKITHEEGRRQLNLCVRRVGESLSEFVIRLKMITRNMYGDLLLDPQEVTIRNAMLVDQFIHGLDTRLANEVLKKDRFRDIDEALAVAERYEEKVSRMVTETRRDAQNAAILNVGAAADVRTQIRQQSPPQRMNYPPSNNRNHFRNNRGRPRSSRQFPGPGVRTYNRTQGVDNFLHPATVSQFPFMQNRCYTCGQQGHRALGCQNPRKVFCHVCGKDGVHWVQCHLNFQLPTQQQDT